MCEGWYLRRRAEADESRRLWEDFERTRRVSEPERPVQEPEVTLEDREREPAAER